MPHEAEDFEILLKIIDFFTYVAYNIYDSVARAPQWGSDKVASANIAAKGSGGLLKYRPHFLFVKFPDKPLVSIFSLAANVFYCRNPYAQIATFIMFLVAARKSLCPFVFARPRRQGKF